MALLGILAYIHTAIYLYEKKKNNSMNFKVEGNKKIEDISYHDPLVLSYFLFFYSVVPGFMEVIVEFELDFEPGFKFGNAGLF